MTPSCSQAASKSIIAAWPGLPMTSPVLGCVKNPKLKFANGNFVSTSIDLKNKSAGDGRRDKTIGKTILRTFRPRRFSRSHVQKPTSRPGKIDVPRPVEPAPQQRTFVGATVKSVLYQIRRKYEPGVVEF
jgi:hypothetical protein